MMDIESEFIGDYSDDDRKGNAENALMIPPPLAKSHSHSESELVNHKDARVHTYVSQSDPQLPVESTEPLRVDDYSKQNGTVVHRTAKCTTNDKRCCLYTVFLISLAAVLSCVILVIVYYIQEKYIQVVLNIGDVRGKLVLSPQGVAVEEYLGIPYAEPPVGDLRYADPVPLHVLPTTDKDAFEAYQHGSSCIQPIDTTFGDFAGSKMWNAQNNQSEDCLFLNIWVPRSKEGDAKWSVMIWLYGGGFFAGSNSLWIYDGRALAAYANVIVVSFNYRVGTFGYLSTSDDRIKGNFGMKDQVLALQWVYDHIHVFGGNNKSITLFGESSGASSAGLHMMSSHSEHLFHRAIFQSGSPDSHWSYMSRAQAGERAEKFLNNVNCNKQNTTAMMTCLRKLDSKSILNNEWVDINFMVFPWAPTIDGDFLTDSPYNLLLKKKFKMKQVLLGVNKDEGTYWNLYGLPGFSKDGPSLQNYTTFATAADIIAWDVSPETRAAVRKLYRDKEIVNISSLIANRDALDKVSGDRSFTCPTRQLAAIFASNSLRTYFYYLTYRASNEVWPPWMGVIHGAEIQWVFGMAMNRSREYTKEEISFSKIIMDYWSNFAKYGDPNGVGGHSLPEWPVYTQDNPVLVSFNGPHNISLQSSLREEFCTLWDDINMKKNTGQTV